MRFETIREALLHKVNEITDLGIMNRSQIATRMGRKPSSLTQYLTSVRQLTEKNILALCAALGVKWQELEIDIVPMDLPPKTARNIYPKSYKVHEALEGLIESETPETKHIVAFIMDAAKRLPEKKSRSKIKLALGSGL